MSANSALAAVFMALCLASPARGQSALEWVGFGALPAASDVVSQGMGGITTLPDDAAGWLASMPATWHNIRATQLLVSVEASEFRLGSLGVNNRVGPQNFQFLMHANRRSAFGIALRPVSRVAAVFSDSIFTPTRDTLRFVQSRSATGGISAFILGYSRRVRPTVALGLTLNVQLGTLTETDTLTFGERGTWDQVLSRRVFAERRLEFQGRTLGLSLAADVPPKSRGNLGVQLTLPLALNLIEVRTYATDEASMNSVRHNDIGSPLSFAAGYGVRLGERLRVLAEVGLTRLAQGGARNLVFGQYLESTRSARLAWSYSPTGEEPILPARLHYRMGFTYGQYYLSDSQNGPLAEIALSIGIGYRSPRFRHRIDVAFQVGQRDTFLDEVREDFYRFSIGVSTAELWFVRPNKKWD
ncbi:MAG: hypothetical protein V3U35_03710 [Candidatus Neomarinimicrobiota bacterium]